MAKDEYIQAVKDLDWQVCKIKAAAYPDPLVRAKDDLKGVKDFWMIELYWLRIIHHLKNFFSIKFVLVLYFLFLLGWTYHQ